MTWADAAQAITDRVIQIRLEARMNKVEFAEIIGVSKQAYTPYEQYETEYTLEQIFIISKYFKKPATWILGIPTNLTSDEDELLYLYRSINDEGLRIGALAAVKGLADSQARAKPEGKGQSKRG